MQTREYKQLGGTEVIDLGLVLSFAINFQLFSHTLNFYFSFCFLILSYFTIGLSFIPPFSYLLSSSHQ